MSLPSIVLGLICSLLIGALFYLWRDGGAGRLLLYFALSSAGFAAGQWLGLWSHWVLFPVGPLDLGLAVPGSIVFLIIGYWLGKAELRRAARNNDSV
jgi:hypothetical protein